MQYLVLVFIIEENVILMILFNDSDTLLTSYIPLTCK